MRLRVLLAAVALAAGAGVAGAQVNVDERAAQERTAAAASAAGIREAEEALEKQDYATAEAKLKVLAAARPKDARVLYDLGFAQERTGEEEAASQAYAAAVVADPALAEPRVALGLLDARAGRADKAHAELTEAAGLTSAAPELRARALRALATMDEASHPEAAREELLAAVKLTGETSQDTLMAAELAAKAGDNADGEVAFRRALAKDPGNVDAAAGLAHVLVHDEKLAEAEKLLSDELKEHPNDPRLVSQLALAYAAEDKAAQAIPLIEQMRASNAALAADSGTTRLLARLYGINGQQAEAQKLYEAMLVKEPRNPELMDDLGSALVKQMKYAEAEAVLAKAVSLRPGFAAPEDWGEAAGHLAFAASKNGDPKTVLQALAARATVLPNSPTSLFLEATAHDTLHETKEAAKAYRAFLAVAHGQFPDQEFQARHRLVALDHMK